MRNIRYAFRLLRANKVFAAVAIFVVALGIGSNVAMFSVIWGVMLQPLPYPHSERMTVVWSKIDGERNGVPADDYLQYVTQSHLLTNWVFSSWTERHMTIAGDPEPIKGSLITPGITQYCGIAESRSGSSKAVIAQIQLGRDYTTNDAKPGNDRVTILNHRLWVEHFHADPAVIGKPVLIDGQQYTIIGVREAGFADKQPSQFDTPLALIEGARNNYFGNVFARLKPGVTMQRAQAEMSAINRRVVANHPKGYPPHWTVTVEPFHNDWLNPKLQRHLWLLFASVGFVLLIACANIASLLLANGISREKEVALRTAIGASRGQVFIQFLTESFVLASIGGLAGIALGWSLMKLAIALLPPDTMPIETDIRLSWPVLLFTLAVTLLSGLLFGCVPAIQSLRLDLHSSLKQGARSVVGGSRIRLQGLLVILEFALTLTLLAGAGLAIHSFVNLAHQDLGFRTDHLLIGYLNMPQKHIDDPAQIRANDRRLFDTIASLPGVQSAALSWDVPLGGHDSISFTIAGQPLPNNSRPQADLNLVTASFRQVYGIRLLRGRFIDDRDTIGTQRVVVVSQSFVRRFLPHTDPLNASVLIPEFKPYMNHLGQPVDYQIVGVVDDIRYGALTEKNSPSAYVAFWQNPWPGLALSIRSTLSTAALLSSVRRVAGTTMPGQAVTHYQTMQDVVDTQLLSDRFGAVLYAAFSCLAMILAAVGIYGVMSFAVAQRKHEMGLRMALGAQPKQVVRLVLRDGMRLAVIGLSIGVAGALILGRVMHSTLYGVGQFDMLSLPAVVLMLFAVAFCANYMPARRATAADPLTVLRQE